MAAEANGSDRPADKRRHQTTWTLLKVLLAVAVCLAVKLIVGQRQAPSNPLRGNMEETPGAVTAAMDWLPAAQRLPFLLRNVTDESSGLRYAAVDALGSYRTPESAAAIETAFRDSSSVVRQRAVETLHVVDRDRGIALLLAALRDEDAWIREAAITQLNRRLDQPADAQPRNSTSGTNTNRATAFVADRRTVPMLIRVLDDTDEVVPQQAVVLLRHLTGRGSVYRTADGPAGKQRVIAEWKSWWSQHASEFKASPDLCDVPPIRPTRADSAPDFNFPDVDGHPLKLSANRGRVTLLNFWGTWCPECRFEMPNLERLHQTYQSSGLDIIGLACAEHGGDAALRTWCAKHSITYRQILAPPELQDEYGDIHEVPVTFLIDKQSRVRYRWDGERDYGTLQAAVERLLAE